MVLRFSFDDAGLAAKAREIRHAVFVEEQHVDPALEYEHDEEAHHYLLMLGEKPVATARWRKTDKGIKLERFAVLPHFRNRGFGEMILTEVLNDVKKEKALIYLHSQLRAVPFYERAGFEKMGEMFTEAGIEHYTMYYKR
jgi:predicted GNAT family N-acyltransferase